MDSIQIIQYYFINDYNSNTLLLTGGGTRFWRKEKER